MRWKIIDEHINEYIMLTWPKSGYVADLVLDASKCHARIHSELF